MKRITLATSILLLVCFYANAQSEFDRGLVHEGMYINSGLGFTFKYPQGWTVHGKETDERIRELGKEKAAASGAESKASLEAALKHTYSLLTVFRHPVGTPGVGFNPAILVMAEKVSHAPGIKNGKDFLLNVRELMQGTGGQAMLKEPTEHTFAGWQFFRDDYSLQSPGGGRVIQAYYAHIIKGYALVFIFMAEDQKGVDELTKSMETLAMAPPVRRGVIFHSPTPKPN
jgi:hypothetical protein